MMIMMMMMVVGVVTNPISIGYVRWKEI